MAVRVFISRYPCRAVEGGGGGGDACATPRAIPGNVAWKASVVGGNRSLKNVQGYLAHKKTPTPLGPPQDPRHRPTVGSYGGVFSR